MTSVFEEQSLRFLAYAGIYLCHMITVTVETIIFLSDAILNPDMNAWTASNNENESMLTLTAVYEIKSRAEKEQT